MSKELLQKIIIGESIKRTLIRAVIIAVFCFVLFRFFLVPIRIWGISMEPTYHDGSVGFVNTLYYKFHDLKRGDLVAIAIGSGYKYMYLKRVVGLPGEKISFKNGALFIDKEEVYEPYIKCEWNWDMEEVSIGENEYFVVGDNRSVPIETHVKGRVNENKIRGKPLW